MTDLILSDESKQYQDLARDFFQNEVAGKSEKLDHDAVFPMDLYKAAWELGLATTFIPERFGGLGLSLWDATVMAEEEGAASGGLAAAFEANALAVAPVLLFGSEAQMQKYLSVLTAEATLASYCVAGKLGTDAAVFSRKGDSFVLNAENVVALNGEHASWYVIAAKEAGGTPALPGEHSGNISVFVFSADLPGITRGAQIHKLGRKCADICNLKISNLELKEENLLGKQGDGQRIILESNCISAPIVAAHAAGLMRCGLENCIRYSKERQTFGKPIGKHQAVGFMMADMAKNAECARLMSWKAASLFDNDVRDHNLALSAKIFAVDAAMTSATDAVQVYGGYGYSKEYPVERLMRDAKMMQMMAGTSFELKCSIAEELMATAR